MRFRNWNSARYRGCTDHISGSKYLSNGNMTGTYVAISHMGVAGKLGGPLVSWAVGKVRTEKAYPARQQMVVCVRHPCVSWILRARQRRMGANTQHQTNCHTILGHLNTTATSACPCAYGDGKATTRV